MANTRKSRRQRRQSPSLVRSPPTSSATTTATTSSTMTNTATNTSPPNKDLITFTNTDPISSNAIPNPKIPKFKGRDDGLEIDAFVAIFERVFKSLSDDNKLIKVVEFLESEPANYFGTEIIPDPLATWATAKDKLHKRYGHSELPPMIAASRRYLQRNESVKEYYDDKCKILRRAYLTEPHMADMLTNGLPPIWRSLFYGKRFTSLADWLQMVQNIEADQKHDNRNKQRLSHVMTTETKTDTSSRNSGRPVPPCQICKRIHIKANHWHRDCPNRNPSSPIPSTPTSGSNSNYLPNPNAPAPPASAHVTTLQVLND